MEKERIFARKLETRWTIFPHVLYRARISAGLTQTELGEKCGWTRFYICKLEKGDVPNIGDDALERLQCALPGLLLTEE